MLENVQPSNGNVKYFTKITQITSKLVFELVMKISKIKLCFQHVKHFDQTFYHFFLFFLLNIFTQDYPLGWVPLQMRGPARNIAQTYKNNIYTKHDIYNYKNIYTGLYTWVD